MKRNWIHGTITITTIVLCILLAYMVQEKNETIRNQEKQIEVLEKQNASLTDSIWNMRNNEMKEVSE